MAVACEGTTLDFEVQKLFYQALFVFVLDVPFVGNCLVALVREVIDVST
jgi:hypothetical protein